MCSGDQFIEHDGVRLHYRTAGNGAAVLLIHGWALDLNMWSPQFPALAVHHQVIAFDRRGFGQSTGEPSVADDVLDAHYLLGALKVHRTAIVGMSQGARVALRCALSFPEAVTCLVLDGPPREGGAQDIMSSEEPPMAMYHGLMQREGVDAVRKAWALHPLMQLRTSDPHMQALLRRMIERYPGRDLRSPAAQIPGITEALDAVHTPTLVINGQDDSNPRLAAGAELTGRLVNAHRSLVAGAGHLPNLDNPARYNELLVGFLRAQAGASPYAKSI